LLKKYIKWGVWRLAVCPPYIQDARFLKVNEGTLFCRYLRNITKSDPLLYHVHLYDHPAASSSSVPHLTKYYERDQNEIGGAYGTYVGEERYI
jgi:hypothetical protein